MVILRGASDKPAIIKWAAARAGGGRDARPSCAGPMRAPRTRAPGRPATAGQTPAQCYGRDARRPMKEPPPL
jgi:hypothetical protein